jgi:glucose-6-phosphate 1-dehydrogenase
MADAQDPALAEVVLGRPKNPAPDATCRFDQVEEPVTIVIFGVTGDLAGRMLLPALASLYAGGNMPENFAIVGASRTDLNDDTFRERMRAALEAFGGVEPKTWEGLAPRMSYIRVHYDDPASFTALSAALDALAAEKNLGGNRIFYLAVPPTAYEDIAVNLAMAGLADETKGHARLVIEKPFGRDLSTARVLEQALHTRSSASTTTWPRRPCRTSSCCASPTPSSSRSGTAATWIT